MSERIRLLLEKRSQLVEQVGQLAGVLSHEHLTKVIGNTAADYIHDFVNSSNPKFEGKSKQERIRMALGAFYGRKG